MKLFLFCFILAIFLFVSNAHTPNTEAPNLTTAPVTDYQHYYNTRNITHATTFELNAKTHVAFFAIPMPGHYFPLLATAEELAKKGYTVTVLGVEHSRRVINSHKHPLVHFFSIGSCSSDVQDWDKLTREMNWIVELPRTAQMIFQWIAEAQPCLFSALYSRLARAQLRYDWDERNPDYRILPPVDFMVIDAVTHGGQDAAQALNIPYMLNNPDIAPALPAQSLGKFDNIPMIFQEQSIHRYNYGMEVRHYARHFQGLPQSLHDRSSVHSDPSVSDNEVRQFHEAKLHQHANYTKILSLLTDLDPAAYQRYQKEHKFEETYTTFSTYLSYHFPFLNRFLHPILRWGLHFFLYLATEAPKQNHRAGLSVIYFFKHVQLYHQLFNSTQTYPFSNNTFSDLCTDDQLRTNYNDYISRHHSTQFTILFPEIVCDYFHRHAQDIDVDFNNFFAPPNDPKALQEYYESFKYLFSPTNTSNQYPHLPQVTPFRFTFPQYSFPWFRRIFNPLYHFTTPTTPTKAAQFNFNSYTQRVWSLYKHLNTYWSAMSHTPGIPTLQDTIIGIEYPRVVSPTVHMVGPLIPDKNSNNLSLLSTTPATERQLAWLSGNDDEDKSNDHDPIIYMSFGTLGHLDHHGTVALFQAYAHLIRTTKLRVMWKLTQHYIEDVVEAYLQSGVHVEGFFDAVQSIQRGASYLSTIQGKIAHYHNTVSSLSDQDIISHNRWFFTEWVFSQYGVLSHENTHLFLSHCGINSAYESLMSGTYTFCIPLFGDQGDMATTLADRNVGVYLWKEHVSKDTLITAIEFGLAQKDTPEFHSSVSRVRRLIELAGGKKRAAEFVEYYIHHGPKTSQRPEHVTRAYIRPDHIDIFSYHYSHLFHNGHIAVDPTLALPTQAWYQFYDFDIFLAHLAFFLILLFTTWVSFKLWSWVFKACCCRSRPAPVPHPKQD